MAETDKIIEAVEAQAEKEVNEAVNPQADAPKKNAVAAEPTHLKNDAEDLGAAVVKPTDSNPDATKKVNQVSGDPQQKAQGSADAMPKLKEEDETEADEKKSEVKEGEMPKAALDALKK
jgi:CMP-2-keto-3-deoxyoctulosonic acid synthetase